MIRKLILLIAVLCLGGCASWEKLSDKERQAWIISGAVVISAAVIANAMDSDTVIVRQCFPQRSLETDCIGKF